MGLGDRTMSTYTMDTTYSDSLSPGETSSNVTSEPDQMPSPTGVTSSPQEKIFWPRDLLPKDFPNARILTFGYDADLVGRSSAAGTRSKLSFSQHGHELMLILNRELADDVSRDNSIFSYS